MRKAGFFHFSVDREKKKITAKRSFDAPLDLVWSAWSEPAVLDQWWAVAPLQTKTVAMDFVEGGYWHYSIGQQWFLFEYEEIVPLEVIAG